MSVVSKKLNSIQVPRQSHEYSSESMTESDNHKKTSKMAMMKEKLTPLQRKNNKEEPDHDLSNNNIIKEFSFADNGS